MDAPAHLLSLKVMRVSRPELASAWQPFYSSSPSFSANSTASILSLQGTTPLLGHPKTLRDLTHTTEFLTLPSSFGSIQLGETFSSCLCINNEAQLDVDGVTVKVEMQTQTSKVVLAEVGGLDHRIVSGDTFESVVTHEVKELGQHVLACTVTYQLPLKARPPGETANDSNLQTFRKFYKFVVTNPLSVKTKVHTPRSSTAMMSLSERDKVFLEVHVQNLTSEPLHFERMQLECAEGWNVEDNNVSADGSYESLFSGFQALMHPQDVRQYIYILTPHSISLVPVTYVPGSTIPLGRLNIFWRSAFGEPGHLLTSMLSRKIPLPLTVQHPLPALASYMRRVTATPSRPQTPQLGQSRPETPFSNTPESPLAAQSRSSLNALVGPVPPPAFPPPAPAYVSDIEVNLVRHDVTRRTIQLEKPFTIVFSLIVSAPTREGKENQRRTVRLVVQHLQHQRSNTTPNTLFPIPHKALSSQFQSTGFSTPSSPQLTSSHQKLLKGSPLDESEGEHGLDGDNVGILPPPFFADTNEPSRRESSGAVFAGPSALFLPAVELCLSETEVHSDTTENVVKAHAIQDFELSYLPTRRGYTTIGGLRILLVEDNLVDMAKNPNDSLYNRDVKSINPAVILKEWGVIAEIWVSP